MLEVHLLGQIELTIQEKPLVFPSKKVEAFFIYLLCQARPSARETLATIFWEESQPEQAQANLRKLLSALRKRVGDYLVVERQTVSFNHQKAHWVDTVAFEKLLLSNHKPVLPTQPLIEQLQEGIALYRGDFLSDVHLPDASDFEAWVTLERERFQYQFGEALRTIVQYCSRHHLYEKGIAYGRQLLQLDSLSEQAHRQLILLLARNGETEAAIRQYDQCRQILTDQLGVPPTQTTKNLVARIQEAVAQPPVLPEPVTSFIGRETELTHIHHKLNDPDCRLLTMLGPGGMGKTRLALQVATERAFDYLNGVYFVSLAAMTEPAAILPLIAAELHLSLTEPLPPLDQLLSYLHKQEMLLVLDNCETLFLPEMEQALSVVAAIVEQAPRVTLLATSRERFNLQVEHLFPLAGLTYPTTDSSADIALQMPAVRLFAERLKEASASFALSAENLAEVVAICELVEGSPLALELAAMAASRDSLAGIAREIGQNVDTLTAVPPTAKPARHHSLRMVFDSSWAQLWPEEQQLFRRLSVFRDAFTAEAAQAVAQAHYATLLGLVDKSFLQLAADGRYHMHQLLRFYGAEQLAQQPGEADEVGRRHCHHYLHFVAGQGQALNGPQVGTALATMRQELVNVKQAWYWALDSFRLTAVKQAIPGLSRYFQLQGPFAEGEALFTLAVDRLAVCPESEMIESESSSGAVTTLLADCRVQAALFFNEQDKYAQAVAYGRQALNEVPGETLVAATARRELGRSYVGLGAFDQAEESLEIGLSLAQRLLKTAAPALVNQLQNVATECQRLLGILALYRGDYKQAQTFFDIGLQWARKIENRWVECGLLNNMGVTAKNLGDLQAARAYYEQNLQISNEIGDRRGRSKTLINLGVVLRHVGHFAAARAAYEEALTLKRAIGDRQGESLALNNLGNVAAQQGDYESARAYFEEALVLYRALNRRRDEGMVLSNLGLLAHILGDDETAVRHCRQALAIARELGDRPTEAYALAHLGHGLLGLNQLGAAERAYEGSITLRQEMGESLLVLESQAGLARVALAQGEPARALRWIEPLYPYLMDEQVGSCEQPFQVYLTCYRVLAAQADGRAHHILRQAHTLLQKQAAQLEDDVKRRSFLENVVSHRQITDAFAQLEA